MYLFLSAGKFRHPKKLKFSILPGPAAADLIEISGSVGRRALAPGFVAIR